MKARSVLFTLFGDVIRPAGGEAWLSTITACMETVGFRPEAVRTALHRMGTEGWVAPRRQGRYAAYQLTERGAQRLEAAAARIYRLRSQSWDGRWRLLLAPTLSGADVVAELGWIGYGRLQPGVWAHPHPHPAEARDLIGSCGHQATWLDAARSDDDAALAARAWALADLQDRHLSFLADWTDAPALAEPPGPAEPPDPAEAFALRLRLVHDWRKFLFADPGLPAEVLPADWPGFRAAEAFRNVYEALRIPSWDFYRGLQQTAPGSTGEPDEPGADSPFARGLAALQQS
ncbi:phenylacetic acid degradation operon negative regulatory protein PaaX [soil metagenome]